MGKTMQIRLYSGRGTCSNSTRVFKRLEKRMSSLFSLSE